ncbi:MAG: quinolinate synthase NadA [Clostridia bacterium]|nr:quinolinate synthase NadA [Clostridia bacterium]
MTTREIQDEIVRLKKEKNICVLAHAYMTRDICEVADYVGDSFGLSQQAAKGDADTVIMCGVRFMAETCKLLSPQKKVILSSPVAGCPMAEQIEKEELTALKETYPGYTMVCYINTTTDLKTECDVCVTSSSAVKIIKKIENDKILFVPDCNLGAFVKAQVPEKQFAFIRGGCPTHLRISVDDVKRAKELHPNALILMHPECHPRVAALADYLGSTTGIMDYAEKSEHKEFLIGTENSIIQHLQYLCPDKSFYPVSKDCVCHNMRVTTLMDVLRCVKGEGGEEIFLSDETMKKAKRCIDEMLRLG